MSKLVLQGDCPSKSELKRLCRGRRFLEVNTEGDRTVALELIEVIEGRSRVQFSAGIVFDPTGMFRECDKVNGVVEDDEFFLTEVGEQIEVVYA